jgi:hypothetical protein
VVCGCGSVVEDASIGVHSLSSHVSPQLNREIVMGLRPRGKKADGDSGGVPAGSLIKVKDLRVADRIFQQIPVVVLEVRSTLCSSAR